LHLTVYLGQTVNTRRVTWCRNWNSGKRGRGRRGKVARACVSIRVQNVDVYSCPDLEFWTYTHC